MTGERAEVEPADAVALLRAHLADDDEAAAALLKAVDPAALLWAAVDTLIASLRSLGVDAELLDAEMARWQAEQHRVS